MIFGIRASRGESYKTDPAIILNSIEQNNIEGAMYQRIVSI